MNEIRSEEQEQIDAIKNWLQEHALSLAAAVVLFCAIVFGPDLYQSYKNNKIWPVSDVYEQFNQAVLSASAGAVATDAELQLVDSLADQLFEQYGDSHYAFLASLTAAKLSVDLGNFEAAKSRLEKAEALSSNTADTQLVTLRLAQVEAQLGDTQAALSRLEQPNSQFASLYAEAKGDIYNSLGQVDEAIASYEEALDLVLDANISQTNTLDAKLQSLRSGFGAIE